MGKTRLTEIQQKEIIELYKTGNYTYKALGRLYKISPVSIIKVVDPKRKEEILAYHRNYEASRKPNCNCVICGKAMYIKTCRLNNKFGHCCSKECRSVMFSKYRRGIDSPSYGLRKEQTANYKGGKYINQKGYYLILSNEHPFRDKNNYVYEHRLIVEQNYQLFDEKYFVVIDGKHYLKKESIVHHKNENKSDNRIENLDVMTKSEHQRLHTKKFVRIKNNKGQYTWGKYDCKN